MSVPAALLAGGHGPIWVRSLAPIARGGRTPTNDSSVYLLGFVTDPGRSNTRSSATEFLEFECVNHCPAANHEGIGNQLKWGDIGFRCSVFEELAEFSVDIRIFIG